jgi:hypothetical protein
MNQAQEFLLRYYRWSSEDFMREIKQGFPFLRRFKSGSAYTVVQMMSTMKAEDQATFARALVKRFHPDATQIIGYSISNEEQRFLDLFREMALEDSPTALLQNQAALAGKPFAGPSRRKMRQLIKTEMQALQLSEQEQESGVFLTYVLRIGAWQVKTEIDTVGEFSEIIYHHNIVSSEATETLTGRDGKEMQVFKTLGRFISLHSWLGISSQTQWTHLTQSEVPGACAHLRLVVSHFLQAAPGLLTGL